MPVTINGTTGIAGPDGSASTPAVQGTDSNTGLFYPAADTAALSTGGSERMRITSAGFVGIGTSSPAVPLDVVAQTSASIARFRGRSSDNIATLEWYDNTNATRYTYISSGPSSSSFWNQANTPMAFGTNDTERMRILSGGNVCINSTTDVLGQGARLHITGNSAQTACSIKIGSDGVPGWYFANSAGTKVGDIVINTSSTAYNTSSDYRLKENVQPMTNALATVAQLNPVTYTWKSTGEAGQGFIAHELQAVVPHAVTGEKDAIKTERVEVSPAVPATYDEEGNELTPAVEAVFEDREVPDYQGVDTSFLVATLTAAIQELKAIVDAQAARISALEAA